MTTRVTITEPTVGVTVSPTWATMLNTALTAIVAAINALGTGADTADLTSAVSANTTNIASNTTAIALKAPTASPTFTGTASAPTPTAADSTTKIATTAFVQGEITAKAPLASPTFTGTPAAPTASPGTNTTQVATTAFVAAATATPALNVQSGSLSGDVAVSATTLTTVLTTSSLAIGTWLLTAGVTALMGGTAGNVDITAAVGGATATFTGQQSASNRSGSVTNPICLTISCIVTVTVAGTILIRAYGNQAFTAKQLATVNSYANATGYTALRIA